MKKVRFLSKISLFLGGFLLCFLAGCGSSQPQDVTIKGELTTADKKPIPKHASAHVSLVQHGGQPNDRRIVAERSLHNLGSKPINFTITVGRALIKPNGYYGLNAQIFDGNGVIRWATPLAVEIKPLKPQKPVSLTLQPSGIKARDAFKRYRCPHGFEFAVETTSTRAILRLAHRRVALDAQTLALAQPKIYIDNHGNRLEIAKDNSSLKLDGHVHNRCTRASARRPAIQRRREHPSPAQHQK